MRRSPYRYKPETPEEEHARHMRILDDEILRLRLELAYVEGRRDGVLWAIRKIEEINNTLESHPNP